MSYHRLAYYITSHGYGHGVRSCSIIRAINSIYPDVSVHIVSELPAAFLQNQVGAGRNHFRAKSCDVGMAQIDSIRVDMAATLNEVRRLLFSRRDSVREEASFLESHSIELVVADIPGVPLEAARLRGIPAVAVGNFGWDWIYSEFAPDNPDWHSAVEMFSEQYAMADLLLRLPFCEKMQAFRRVEDIPLVANPGRPCREKIMELAGCDPNKQWILLSFTSLDWNEHALSLVEGIESCEFLTVLPLKWRRRNIHALDREQVSFSDVIASVDAVVSKPGFGILSDCIVNRKPLIYADRTNFLEYPILEEAIKKYLKHVHIPAEKLYRGDLLDSLEGIWSAAEPPEAMPWGGDVIAARRIASFFK